MADLAELAAWIEPEAKALGLELVRVALFGGKSDPTLQVMAERPDTRQLTIDDCAALSRRLSDRLDAMEAEGSDPIEHAYRLEVSSPGIDRPLTRLADYRDWSGHEARVTFGRVIEKRKRIQGPIAGVEGERVTIDVKNHGPMTVDFTDIAEAKLVLTDALIAATQPLSAEGADEIVEMEG